MRIGLDVRYLSHGLVGGVRNYVAQFTETLVRVAVEHDIVLYADTKAPFELHHLPNNVTVRLLPWHGPQSSIYYDLFLKKYMQQDNLDIAHFTGNYGFGPKGSYCVITLQDEINLLPLKEIIAGHKKTPRVIAMMTYLHLMTRAAVQQADLIITVSEYSRQQIMRYSGISPQQIAAVHHACPHDIQRIEDPALLHDVRQRLNLNKPFILAEAFKNPGVLVRAWQRLPQPIRDQHEIIFFSRSPDVLPIVHEAIRAGIARMFVRPQRSDLSALYTMAAVFVFPSWIEGFGIPLVEAMTCGTPIIASNRGSIPEVVDQAGYIIDAEDDQALAHYLVELLTNPDAAETLRQRGFARVKQFSWTKNAQRVIELYHSLLATRPSQPRAHVPKEGSF